MWKAFVVVLVAMAADAAADLPEVCKLNEAVPLDKANELARFVATKKEVAEALKPLPASATPDELARALDAAAENVRAEIARDARRADSSTLTTDLKRLTDRAAELHGLSVASQSVTVETSHTAPKGTDLHVVLTNPPTTRLRISLDRTDGSGHQELEWDPAVATALLQRTHLDDGTWRISASVDPLVIQQGDGSMIVATRFQALTGGAGTFMSTGVPSALVGNSAFPDSAKQIAMKGWPEPTLAFTCESTKPKIADLSFATQLGARGAAQRSAVAPEILTQTLSILAEIAVERAKAGAMEVVKERFVNPLCSDDQHIALRDLHLGNSTELAFPRTCKLLLGLRLEDVLSGGDGLLRALRDDARFTIGPAVIAQLTSHEPSLQRVLLAVYDVVNRAIDRGTFDGLEAQLLVDAIGVLDDAIPAFPVPLLAELAAPLKDPNLAAVKTAICGTTDVAACLQKLSTMPHTVQYWFDWIVAVSNAAKPADVIAAAADVLDTAPAQKLRGVLCPQGAATTAACLTQLVTDFPTQWSVVAIGTYLDKHTDVVKILRNLIGSDPESIVGRAVPIACDARLAVAIIKRCAGGACTSATISQMIAAPESYFAPEATFPADLCWTSTDTYLRSTAEVSSVERIVIDGIELVDPSQLSSGQDRAVAAINFALEVIARIRGTQDDRVATLGEIATALVRGQWDTALMSTIRLVGDLAKDQRVELPDGVLKLAALAGAVASYAEVYKSTKDADPKAARAARKAALESLIDAATNRVGRDAATVLSIGSNVGMSWRWANSYTGHGDFTDGYALRVPLGIAVQVLPSASHCHFGLHGALNIFDLGQFIRSSDTSVRWDSFVAPGAELGVLFGSPSHALSLVAHAAFVPGNGDPDMPTKQHWELGFSLGYYVPFFDLN